MSANIAKVNEVPKKQPVSVRKAEANRQNALKSTGPKTPKGKMNSRRNAIKHGLFIRHTPELFLDAESNGEFLNFHKRLWTELQPVGPREESEVAYIAVCWLRLDRLFRYENAEVQSGVRQIEHDVENGVYHPCSLVSGRSQLWSLLLTARAEAVKTGQVSPDLIQKIFEEDVHIKIYWQAYEEHSETIARKKVSQIANLIADKRNIPLGEAKLLLDENPKAQPEYSRMVTLGTVQRFLDERWDKWWQESLEIRKNARQLEAIPAHAVDKVIRYGNAFERHLSRAYARLERLQARRKGESVLPIVDVHLTH
jgi:hypothetical protein